MRRFLLLWVAFFPMMAVFVALTPGLYQVDVSSTLNVRDAPGGLKIGSLSDGDLVQVIACENGWAQVSLAGGGTGYVSERYLVSYSPPVTSSGTSHPSISFYKLKHYAD